MHTGLTYSARDNKVKRTKNTWKSIFSTDWIGSFELVGQNFPNVQYHHEERTYASCHMSKWLINYFALIALIARPLDCLRHFDEINDLSAPSLTLFIRSASSPAYLHLQRTNFSKNKAQQLFSLLPQPKVWTKFLPEPFTPLSKTEEVFVGRVVSCGITWERICVFSLFLLCRTWLWAILQAITFIAHNEVDRLQGSVGSSVLIHAGCCVWRCATIHQTCNTHRLLSLVKFFTVIWNRKTAKQL